MADQGVQPPFEGRFAEISFEVMGPPVPKPRMTRRDKWIMKRPRNQKDVARAEKLRRYWEWVGSVQWQCVIAGRVAGIRFPGRMFSQCRMGFKFHIAGHPDMDLDNCIKGAKDALKGVAYEDDKSVIVPGYYDDPEFVFLCDTCAERGAYSRGPSKGKPKPDCGAVDRCMLPKSVIKIKGTLTG